MKKLLLAGLLLASITVVARGWETIKGNGNLKTETRPASGYTSISAAGAFDVDIQYGNQGSLTVEADENLLPYIETVVDGDELKLRTKKGYNIKSSHKMRVVVSLTRLRKLSLSGSGNVKGKGNFNNDGTTEVSISGSGNVQLDFGKFESIDLQVSGSGNMTLKGKETGKLNAKISGSGNIEAYDVQAADVVARVSGSGNIHVTAHRSVDAVVSGSGNVVYRGTANDIRQKSSGSGKVRKA